MTEAVLGPASKTCPLVYYPEKHPIHLPKPSLQEYNNTAFVLVEWLVRFKECNT